MSSGISKVSKAVTEGLLLSTRDRSTDFSFGFGCMFVISKTDFLLSDGAIVFVFRSRPPLRRGAGVS